MEHCNQVFIMGNKRSGTTLLVILLNLHPNVFITYESDVIWILYQARNGKPSRYKCYPWDDSWGMKATLKTCHHILQSRLYRTPNSDEAITETFFQIQMHLMHTDLRHRAPQQKTHLLWLGDKKPVQHSDPMLRNFLHMHFPHARYIHIVRDPRAVVASMSKAAKEWGKIGPSYWKGTPHAILERWAIHEEWVLQAKSTNTSQIYTLRLEDLCADPIGETTKLFRFLDLESPTKIADWFQIPNLRHSYDDPSIREAFPILRNPDNLFLNLLIKPNPNYQYKLMDLPTSPRVDRIMKIYGYAR